MLAVAALGAPAYAQVSGVTYNVIYSFSNGANGLGDGFYPLGSLALGSDGSYYGTTEAGGVNNEGTVFKLTSSGTMITVHSFPDPTVTNDGHNPVGGNGLIQDSTGNWYGTTATGGTNSTGTVFEITPTGTYSIIYSFGLAPDGFAPYAGLTFDANGNLWGTTLEGEIGRAHV